MYIYNNNPNKFLLILIIIIYKQKIKLKRTKVDSIKLYFLLWIYQEKKNMIGPIVATCNIEM